MNDKDAGARTRTTRGVPLDHELHTLFRAAADDVQLRHGPDDVLEASRAARQLRDSRRRAAIGAVAVAATVAAVIGVGATQLPSVTSTPSGPSATETDPADGDPTPRPGSATSPLTFFVADGGLVSRVRPDLDLTGAVADTIRGEGEPPGSRTAWLNVPADRSIDVRTTDAGAVVEIDLLLEAVDFQCAGGPGCAEAPMPAESEGQRLAMQQVAWTVAAYLGTDTGVRLMVDGKTLADRSLDVPELVYADPEVFADLQVLRPASGLETRRSLILEGWTARPATVQWAFVPSDAPRSVRQDPFADVPIGAIPLSGEEPAETDPVTGRGFFSVGLTFNTVLDGGLYSLVIQSGDARTERAVVVRR